MPDTQGELGLKFSAYCVDIRLSPCIIEGGNICLVHNVLEFVYLLFLSLRSVVYVESLCLVWLILFSYAVVSAMNVPDAS